MQRTRYYTTDWGIDYDDHFGATFVEHVGDPDSGPGWFHGQYSDLLTGPSTWKSGFMQDFVQKGVWRYNPCTNITVDEQSGAPATSSPGTAFFARLPPIVASRNISVGSHAIDTSGRCILEAAKLEMLHDIRLRDVSYYQHAFSHGSLPRTFEIKRDPFDTAFSAYYVLVDLLDFKKLFQKLLSRSLKPMKSLRKQGLSRKDVAANIANTNLGIQFGILPTVRDIQELISTIRTWKETYDRVKLTGKRYVSHAKIEKLPHEFDQSFDLLPWEEELSIAHPTQTFPISTPLVVGVKCEASASWHAQAQYGFDCPEFAGWTSRLAQITDSFGLLDPAAAWDVIPFSFVIDWFFSVSSWLHANRPRLFPANVVIYDYLETVKIVRRFTYELTTDYISESAPYWQSYTALLGREVHTHYLRRRFVPPVEMMKFEPRARRSADSFVQLSRLGISTSLIAQRLPRS